MFTKWLRPNNSSTKTFFSRINKPQLLVRVSALDHDGCLGLQYMPPGDLHLMQAPLIEFLNQQKQQFFYDYDYLMSSSNRQSIPVDCLNAIHNQNNLAFPAIEMLARKIGGYFDGFLLADITENQRPGFTVTYVKKRASLQKINLYDDIAPHSFLYELLQQKHADYAFSEEKINICYAQMHRIAMIHPLAQIHFHYYDDLYESVLNKLIIFYTQNAELIPFNVQLKFYYFNTAHPSNMRQEITLPEFINTIEGKGSIDRNYYQTIRIMEKIARDNEGINACYQMSAYITQELITKCRSDASPLGDAPEVKALL